MRERRFPLLLTLVFGCATLASCRASMQDTTPARAIADLAGQHFHVTTVKGRPSMTLLSAGVAQSLAEKGSGKPCDDNVARLNRAPSTAVHIGGTPFILAFLDCPANNNGGAGSIVALFDYRHTISPRCFTYIQLMGDSSYHFWGAVRSLELRQVSADERFVAVTLRGGDAGDDWTSYAFLHVNNQCETTPLAKVYASTYEEPGERTCTGHMISYRFVDDSSVELETQRLVCTTMERKTEVVGTKRFDLKALLRDASLRVFEPK